MSIKYCVTITTRGLKFEDVVSFHARFDTIADLNTYLFEKICNTKQCREIICLYFDVINSIDKKGEYHV